MTTTETKSGVPELLIQDAIKNKYETEFRDHLCKNGWPNFFKAKSYLEDHPDIFSGHELSDSGKMKMMGIIVSGMPEYEKNSRSVYRLLNDMKTIVCEYCGKNVSILATSQGRFCPECRYKNRGARTRKCSSCGDIIPKDYKPRYISDRLCFECQKHKRSPMDDAFDKYGEAVRTQLSLMGWPDWVHRDTIDEGWKIFGNHPNIKIRRQRLTWCMAKLGYKKDSARYYSKK